MDSMLNNKFMRVRSPLEQYERGEVFGTDFSSWKEPIDTIIRPTINSFISQNPIFGGAKAAFAASLFVKSRPMKTKVGGVVGGLVAAASVVRGIRDLFPGVWTPRKYRRQGEIDEYFDTLEYVKQVSIAKRAREDAYIYEGVNLLTDPAQDSSYTFLVQQSEKKANETMYAFDVATGTLDQALASIAERKKQIAQEVILYASKPEKKRFYDLLPDSEKRVLGKFLLDDLSEVPEKKSLTKFFEDKYLPGPNWEGWNKDADIEMVARLASEAEDTNIVGASEKDFSTADAAALSIPRMDNPTIGNIRKQIESISRMMNIPIDLRFNTTPAKSNKINLNFNIFHNRSGEVHDNIEQDIRRV